MGPIIRKRALEIRIISGENLSTDDRNPVMENMYVVIRAESIKCWRTKMAKPGAGSLSTVWNEKLMVEVPLHAQSITFEVQCEKPKGMVRSIGLARVAIGDVIAQEEKCLPMLSYRLRNWEGRRSGVINFSVKVMKKEQEEAEKKGIMVKSCGAFGSGVVTGIPVCWIHPGIPVRTIEI